MSPRGLVCLLLGATLPLMLGACGTPPTAPLDSLHQETVLIEHAKGHGTGIIVGPHTVLTAYHVVQEAPLEVTFFRGPAVDGQVSWYDEGLDLALVDVAVPAGYPTTELSCDDLRAGEHLISIGHPTHSRWVAVGGDSGQPRRASPPVGWCKGAFRSASAPRAGPCSTTWSRGRDHARHPRRAQLGQRRLRPLQRGRASG